MQGAAGDIAVWWIGGGDPAAAGVDERMMQATKAQLEAVFDSRVVLARRAGRPADAHDARRKQTSSTRLLGWLASEAPPEAERVLGLTDEDLFIPVLTYVFGEAQLNGKAAVVSVARLVPGRWVAEGAYRLLQARLIKECVHELGHAFGLLHCERPACAMARSPGVADVDSKQGTLCPDCQVRLRQSRRAGSPSSA